MASEQVTLIGDTISVTPLDAAGGRIVITQLGVTLATVYATADGTAPVIPTPGTEVPNNQVTVPAILGAQAILPTPLFGDHMANPTVRMLSAGTPTVSLNW